MHKPGTQVKIAIPDNPYANGQVAEVITDTPYGYILRTKFGTGEFRVIEGEIEELKPERNGVYHSARAYGYDENPCPRCGAFKLKRAGACLCCDECGETTGCS